MNKLTAHFSQPQSKKQTAWIFKQFFPHTFENNRGGEMKNTVQSPSWYAIEFPYAFYKT